MKSILLLLREALDLLDPETSREMFCYYKSCLFRFPIYTHPIAITENATAELATMDPVSCFENAATRRFLSL